MRRELLLEKIEELKAIMPWFILDYYQSKLTVPYTVSRPCMNTSRNTDAFLNGYWMQESQMQTWLRILTSRLLENLSKKDMETFILYLRERPSLNTYSTKQGVSQTTINRTLSALWEKSFQVSDRGGGG